MLVTNCQQLCDRVLFLRDHGRKPGDKLFYNSEVAFKYKMSSMQAALGLAQLERIEELIARKREIFSWYAEELRGVPGLTLNDGWDVRLIVRNLWDEPNVSWLTTTVYTGPGTIFPGDNRFNNFHTLQQPRTIGLQITKKFTGR